jgi:hypothetical protein
VSNVRKQRLQAQSRVQTLRGVCGVVASIGTIVTQPCTNAVVSALRISGVSSEAIPVIPPRVECRGADADQPTEFTRQRTKLLAALAGLDADVIGLLYRPGVVRPVGSYKILDSSVDPRFRDALNRPSLAQTFEFISTSERITVAVNHLKSKGLDCNAVGDVDLGDGQGNCNQTRSLAKGVLIDLALAQRFGFGGFTPPVDPPPALNSVNAGAAVPSKFSLDGDREFRRQCRCRDRAYGRRRGQHPHL